VGLKYRGYIRSFNTGFQVRADNTQLNMDAVSQVGVRCVNSQGGQFGTSPYRLEPIQELKQEDLNYLPPLPMNTTKVVDFVDDHDRDKEFVLVQNTPGPLQVTAVLLNNSAAVTQ